MNRHEFAEGRRGTVVGQASQMEGTAHAKAWRRKSALKIMREKIGMR